MTNPKEILSPKPGMMSRKSALKLLAAAFGTAAFYPLTACTEYDGSLDLNSLPEDPYRKTEGDTFDTDRVGYAALLLGGQADNNIPKIEFPEIESYKVIKTNLNGKQVVYYNPDIDSFIKLDMRPQVAENIFNNQHPSGPQTALLKELQGQRASAQVAFNLADDAAENMVKLVKVTGVKGETLAGVKSPYFGVTVTRALQTGAISVDDLPLIVDQLHLRSDQIFQRIGMFNKDLNSNNVLINTSKGSPDIIIIDWANSSHNASINLRASALKKFFVTLFGGKNNPTRNLVIENTFNQTGSPGLRQVLIELSRRESISHTSIQLAKRGLPGVLALVGLALTVTDAQASFKDAAQQGDFFHIDISLYDLLQSGMPNEIANAAYDESYQFKSGHVFLSLPFIPLNGPTLEKIQQQVLQGHNKELVINNFFDDRSPFLPNTMFTGMSVTMNENGSLQFIYLGSQETINDGDNINIVTMGADDNGRNRGYVVWECEFRTNFVYTHDNSQFTYPYAIIPKNLAFFAPAQ